VEQKKIPSNSSHFEEFEVKKFGCPNIAKKNPSSTIYNNYYMIEKKSV